MRVLHVFSGLRRNGAESRTMDIYRNIDRSRVQFDFVVHTNEKCDFDEEVLQMGAKIYRVPSYKIYNHVVYCATWDKLFQKHPEYNVIHIHTTNTAAPILAMAKKNGVQHRIVHARNAMQSGFIKKQFLKMTRKQINDAATLRFAVSKEAGDYVFGKEKYKILPNAIETRKYKFSMQNRECYRKKLNIENKITVGHIGRFIEQKNHTWLIDVFQAFHVKHPESALLLVGVGEKEQEIEEYVRNRKLTDAVIFLGKRSDVPKLLSALDVFVFPSLFEGLPGVVLEA